MRSLRARLAPGQRIFLVVVLAGVLAVAAAVTAGPGGWYAYAPLTSSIYVPRLSGTLSWTVLAAWLVALAAWAAASWRLLGARPTPPAR